MQSVANMIEQVGAASESFAARRMNHGIKAALSGHTLDDLENF